MSEQSFWHNGVRHKIVCVGRKVFLCRRKQQKFNDWEVIRTEERAARPQARATFRLWRKWVLKNKITAGASFW